MMDEHLPAEIVAAQNGAGRRANFVERLQGAEQHWFFVQALDCLDHELYLPATLSFLGGIEATLRVCVNRYSGDEIDWISEPSAYRVLSNTLIGQAREIGLKVERLAFPEEGDFNEKLVSAKPDRRDVQLVALRNNICHGNVCEFFEDASGEGNVIFVPELLKPVATHLLNISEAWATEVQSFLEDRNKRK